MLKLSLIRIKCIWERLLFFVIQFSIINDQFKSYVKKNLVHSFSLICKYAPFIQNDFGLLIQQQIIKLSTTGR